MPRFSSRKSVIGRRLLASSALALGVLGASLPAVAQEVAVAESAAPAVAATAQATADIVSAVNIPHEIFKLENGLTVIVHEDRKAPVVAVSVWYGVGSKHEPEGKTGYAHLFEHIMFNGSENAPLDYFTYTRDIGATDLNGTTWLDRTNYFQTVPKPALEAALFLESDRMGYLLGGLDQAKLDNQINVVSNEKRQGESQPYGLVSEKQIELLIPKSHPYGHDTIGSLADLRAASLDDMKTWFTDHYGPNNSILVLAGDINVAEARPLVERYFGAIKPGKPIPDVSAPIPARSEPVTEVMYDKVPNARIYRNWIVPGLAEADFTEINAASAVLGGLASSRLDNIMVKGEKIATSVSSYVLPFMMGSMFTVQIDVKEGQDIAAVSARLDTILADLIANGPTQDEVTRLVNSQAAGTIRGLEQVGGFNGKATALAEGLLYAGDSNYYKAELARLAAVTPAGIKAAAGRWLTRPKAEIHVLPGDRPDYTEEPAPAAAPAAAMAAAAAPVASTARAMPSVGAPPAIDFPTVETATLSNGVKVHFARRATVPVVQIAAVFDAGAAADPLTRRGTHGMMTAMLDEGTARLNSIQLAEQRERLGAQLFVSGDLDSTTVQLSALKANLADSLDMMADVIKAPSFDAAELERVRQQQLNSIAAESSNPQAIALRNLPPLIYGADHPYGAPLTGTGDAQVVASLTRDELVAFHAAWLHPSKATLFVVGDTTLAEIRPMLEARFGRWQSSATPGTKSIDAAVPAQTGKIVVINQPNSPQSLIIGGAVLDAKGRDDLFNLLQANEVLGGGFTSRINMDLRETKGWAYGAGSTIQRSLGQVPFLVFAPVQTDKTGPSVAAVIEQISAFKGANGTTDQELASLVKGNIGELPGSYEQSGSVLGQMINDKRLGRPFDYVEGLEARYRSLTTDQLNEALRSKIDPSQFTWLVVGDVAKIRDQIDALGIPTQYVGAPAAAPAAAGGE